MMRTNYQVNDTLQFRILSDDQIEEIFLSALQVLERTGARVHSEEGLSLLKKAGGRLSGGDLAYIPSWLVKDALNKVPGQVVVAGRDRTKRVELRRERIHYMTSSGSPFMIDPQTDERRPFTIRDVRDAARIADALPNIDVCMALGSASDVPAATRQRHHLLALAQGTTKPLAVRATDVDDLADQYRMACALVGGEAEFERSPLFVVYLEPASPLVHGKAVVDELLYAVEKGIPVVYAPVSIAADTGPAPMAGVLVQHVAGFLTGLVLCQLQRPGASVLVGGTVSIKDLQTNSPAYGAPEMALLSAGMAQVAGWLRLPVVSTGGGSDARVFDQQAAMEAANSIAIAGLAGTSLVRGVGCLGAGDTGSYDMLVMGDEIIGMCKHIYRGVAVDEEHLAVDVIDHVGPGGHFLMEDHTLKHFRTQHWFPRFLERGSRETWETGGSRLLSQRVRDGVLHIMGAHEPAPISPQVEGVLGEIVAEADRRHAAA